MSNTSLRVIFAGTPELAVPTLQALIASPHEVIAVYTQPDRPAGRGRQLAMSPIKQEALKHQLPIYQPETLKDPQAQEQLVALKADVMIVLGYGLLLPNTVLNIPRYGCINVHVSLLPRWRGAAPIQRAILAGDKISGVSIMQMDAGLDTGPVFAKAECILEPEETSQTLHDKLAHLGAQTLLPVLAALPTQTIKALAQDDNLTCYAYKLTKTEAKLDWQQPAEYLERCVRAFIQWPVAYFDFKGEAVRVFAAKASTEKTSAAPGTILQVSKQGLEIATQKGSLNILRLQLPGSKPMNIADLLNGKPHLFQIGQQLA